MSDYQTFAREWLGRRVGDPLLVGRGESTETMYQCVSLIKQYWTECYGIVVDWPGNAIDLWNNTNAGILTKFGRVGGNDAQQGDIVVLFGLNGNPYGHVGIATGGIDGTNVEILEQNGATGGGTGTGGDAIRTRFVSRSRVAGLLRPIQVAVPVFTPPTAPAPTYTITETYPEGKQVKLNKQPTNLWGMNYHFDYMKDHPVEIHNAGEIVTVTNKVHHEDGYDYYRREGQVDGFNVLDCDDYTPPVVPPAAPVPFPGNGEKYELIVHLNGYQSGTQAGNHTGPATPLEPGEYSIYRYYPSRTDLINITRDKTKPGWWINAKDNVIPPPPEPPKPERVPYVSPRGPSVEPEPEVVPVVVNPVPPEADTSWKSSFISFYPNSRKPIRYVFLQDFELKDLAGSGNTLHCKKYDEVSLYGTFEKDGTSYGRPKRRDDAYFKFYYGIPLTMADGTDPGIVEPEQKLYDPSTTIEERKSFKVLTLHDREVLAIATLEKAAEPLFKMIDGVFRKPRKK